MRRASALVACIALLGAWCLIGMGIAKADDSLAPFLDTFVGVSENFDGDGHPLGERHVDMVIREAGADGFEIELVSVALVDGRRDLPGVKRRSYVALFRQSDTAGIYLAEKPFDPFEERQAEELFAGAPLEWAQVSDGSLTIYTFAILEDGRYESQVFERAFDGKDTLATLYQRHLDGTLERQTIGRMVRSKD